MQSAVYLACIACYFTIVTAATPPYATPAAGLNSSKQLYVVQDGDCPSDDDRLFIQSLQGLHGRQMPLIYRNVSNNGAEIWIRELSTVFGVALRPMPSTVAGIISMGAPLTSPIQGFVLALNSSKAGPAILAAAGMEGAVVATPSTRSQLESKGFSLLLDCTELTYEQVLDKINTTSATRPEGPYARRLAALQDDSKSAGSLTDVVISSRAIQWWDTDMGSALSKRVLGSLHDGSAVFGWGSNEGETVAAISPGGSFVHASDFSSNLATLSGYRLPPMSASRSEDDTSPGEATAATAKYDAAAGLHATASRREVASPRHTVCFLMTDGDNLQWLENDFATNALWWASPQRGTFPLGWTLSPASYYLAPALLHYLKRTATGNDSFVAAPSGAGYSNPDVMAKGPGGQAAIRTFAGLTTEYSSNAGLDIVNVIGQNYDAASAAQLLDAPSMQAAFWYNYRSYSDLNGKIDFVRTPSGAIKPVIGGRFQLWTGTFYNTSSIVTALDKMPADPTSSDGYSLVPVHVWSDSVANAAKVAAALQAQPDRYDLVLPGEFVRRIKENLKPGLGRSQRCLTGSVVALLLFLLPSRLPSTSACARGLHIKPDDTRHLRV